MMHMIALFMLFILVVCIFCKIKWGRGAHKTVHWNELLDIEETYSALEYDRHSDYLRRL